MEPPKFLIACHCASHFELFLTKRGEAPVSLKSSPLKENVEYVDLGDCQGKKEGTTDSWDKIPSASKDYVVLIGCPLAQPRFGIILRASLFVSSYRVLKPGGKVLMTNSTMFLSKLLPEPIVPALFDIETYPLKESPIDVGFSRIGRDDTGVVVAIHTKKAISSAVESSVSKRITEMCSTLLTMGASKYPDKLLLWEKFLTFIMLVDNIQAQPMMLAGRRNNRTIRKKYKLIRGDKSKR